MGKQGLDMTAGAAGPLLIRYAIPLVLGNLFQLAYNVADSIIVGQWIGREALAAEAIASPVMNLLILGISGVCIGAGVIMSEHFGAKRYEQLRTALASLLFVGIVLSAAGVCAGLLLTPWLLDVLSVPPEIRAMTGAYLRLVLLGAPCTYLYNALAAALKSIGDSRTPLLFLMLSCALNAGSDVVLIGFFGYGIVCSAVTTVAAQAISAGLTLAYLQRRTSVLRLGRADCRVDPGDLRRMLQMGGVTALQQCVQPLCKLLMQGCVNTLGVDSVAAYHAVTRMDDFAFLPTQSVGSGITTFLAQNNGAGRADRMRSGYAAGLRIQLVYSACLCAVTLLFRRQFVSMFVSGAGNAEIVEIGAKYLSFMAFFYFFPAVTNSVRGYFRGVGRMGVTLLGTVIQATLRCTLTYILAPRFGIAGIPFACATGWTLMLVYELPVQWADRRRRENN